jgi:hypothetical protein
MQIPNFTDKEHYNCCETKEWFWYSYKGNPYQIRHINKETGFCRTVKFTKLFYMEDNHIELEAVKRNNEPLTFVLKFIEQEQLEQLEQEQLKRQPKRQLKQQYKQEHFKRQELVKMHYNQRQFKHRRLNQPNKFK